MNRKRFRFIAMRPLGALSYTHGFLRAASYPDVVVQGHTGFIQCNRQCQVLNASNRSAGFHDVHVKQAMAAWSGVDQHTKHFIGVVVRFYLQCFSGLTCAPGVFRRNGWILGRRQAGLDSFMDPFYSLSCQRCYLMFRKAM